MNIYITRDGQQFGPYTLDQINSGIFVGNFTPSDLAWIEGWTDWQPLSMVPSIVPFKSNPPPLQINHKKTAEQFAYKSWNEVPFYRKQWFFWLMYVFINPIGLIFLIFGDVFYLKEGKIKTFGWPNRIVAAILAVIIISNLVKGLLIFNPVLGGCYESFLVGRLYSEYKSIYLDKIEQQETAAVRTAYLAKKTRENIENSKIGTLSANSSETENKPAARKQVYNLWAQSYSGMPEEEITAADTSETGPLSREARETATESRINAYRMQERYSSSIEERFNYKKKADRLEDLHEASLLRDKYADIYRIYDITDVDKRNTAALLVAQIANKEVASRRILKNANP